MENFELKAPWKESLGELPFHMEYFQGSMFEAVRLASLQFPDFYAYEFLGVKVTYKQFVRKIENCARTLKMIGIREKDRVTIALPNIPQALIIFYALNCIGAVSNVVHPLSAEKELEGYVKLAKSRYVITLDQFYSKFENIAKNNLISTLILTSVKDELALPVAAGYMLTEGRKVPRVPKDAPVIWWKDLMRLSAMFKGKAEALPAASDTAAILYSGGTTGTTKGVELTNLNFNANAAHIVGVNQMFRPGDKMLAALPIFHGFGLGVCIHSMLVHGGDCILMPRFTADSYAKLIVKVKCNFLAGVPTLFEALTRTKVLENADLSFLKGVFSGGDSLSIELKKKLDNFLYDHGSPVQVREGYGATETVAACCLTPPDKHKEGSIGLPFPDTYFRIVDPDSGKDLGINEVGEIVISGPAVMKGYIDNPEETSATLKEEGGHIWCHTGDLGLIDGEGFIFFKGRAKRMIISSGYNIYPAQMENILEANKMVRKSCVIGVPDPYRMQKVKAFVVLEDGYEPGEDTWLKLMAYCKKHIARYAMPYDIEFRTELPKTMLGKVAYRVLEDEENERLKNQAE